TGGSGSDVVDQRTRHIQPAIAGELGAEAEVDIFEIGKKRFLEETDPVEEGAAIERRAGTGPEDLLLAVEAPIIHLSAAVRDRDPVPTHRAAGIVETLPD